MCSRRSRPSRYANKLCMTLGRFYLLLQTCFGLVLPAASIADEFRRVGFLLFPPLLLGHVCLFVSIEGAGLRGRVATPRVIADVWRFSFELCQHRPRRYPSWNRLLAAWEFQSPVGRAGLEP
ncbi:hypothetical protein BJ741DRAFT_612638 [Chytriomyces cf. hyalinus JEL632]|nr:hypothetical protein BJ741DRAFT_612638 [Chytriomyces cf. hyalinus JEL632]